jgi:hypothetical protein
LDLDSPRIRQEGDGWEGKDFTEANKGNKGAVETAKKQVKI